MPLSPDPAADLDPIIDEWAHFEHDDLTPDDIDRLIQADQIAQDWWALCAEAEERDAFVDAATDAW